MVAYVSNFIQPIFRIRTVLERFQTVGLVKKNLLQKQLGITLTVIHVLYVASFGT